MRVAVCLSTAIDPEERLQFTPGRGLSNLAELRQEMNRADACGLEEALRLKDGRPDAEVIALSMGPPSCEGVLREAMGLGADGVFRVWDEGLEGADALTTAKVLARAAYCLHADIVICGERAADGATGQVATQMAELMGMPVVTGVVRIQAMDSGEALADQRLERGLRRRARCGLPAVFSIEEGANRPRYPRLRDRLRARGMSVPLWGIAELGLEPEAVGQAARRTAVVRLSGPKPTSKNLFAPDSELSAEERLAQVLGGALGQTAAPAEADAVLSAGSPADKAGAIMRFLAQGKYL